MADETFDRVVQLRLSARQHRYLKLAAATDYTSASYAPVVRDLIDAAIEDAHPKWRRQLDLSEDEFADLLANSF